MISAKHQENIATLMAEVTSAKHQEYGSTVPSQVMSLIMAGQAHLYLVQRLAVSLLLCCQVCPFSRLLSGYHFGCCLL